MPKRSKTTDSDALLETGTQIHHIAGNYTFIVPDKVNVISLYGCGGGDGGHSGRISYGYQVPGPGGSGGNGSVPHYWVEAGGTHIPVNPGDVFNILVGAGGESDQPGTPTVITQHFPATGAPDRRYLFGSGYGPVTLGGSGAGSGRQSSRPGASTPDPRTAGHMITGGQGFVTFPGANNDHWGGAGGGGGAGMGAGGDGGLGGCDGGSQVYFPGGSHSPDFRAAHSGKLGANGHGSGAGGGGGGGPGDGADDWIFDPGGHGGRGGDGYIEIAW